MQLRTPEQILSDKNNKAEQLLNRLETEIAAELERKYIGEPLEIWVDGYMPSVRALIVSLQKRFRESGWEITLQRHIESQKDGDRVCFLLSASDPKNHEEQQKQN